jgi:hypothetical protein
MFASIKPPKHAHTDGFSVTASRTPSKINEGHKNVHAQRIIHSDILTTAVEMTAEPKDNDVPHELNERHKNVLDQHILHSEILTTVTEMTAEPKENVPRKQSRKKCSASTVEISATPQVDLPDKNSITLATPERSSPQPFKVIYSPEPLVLLSDIMSVTKAEDLKDILPKRRNCNSDKHYMDLCDSDYSSSSDNDCDMIKARNQRINYNNNDDSDSDEVVVVTNSYQKPANELNTNQNQSKTNSASARKADCVNAGKELSKSTVLNTSSSHKSDGLCKPVRSLQDNINLIRNRANNDVILKSSSTSSSHKSNRSCKPESSLQYNIDLVKNKKNNDIALKASRTPTRCIEGIDNTSSSHKSDRSHKPESSLQYNIDLVRNRRNNEIALKASRTPSRCIDEIDNIKPESSLQYNIDLVKNRRNNEIALKASRPPSKEVSKSTVSSTSSSHESNRSCKPESSLQYNIDLVRNKRNNEIALKASRTASRCIEGIDNITIRSPKSNIKNNSIIDHNMVDDAVESLTNGLQKTVISEQKPQILSDTPRSVHKEIISYPEISKENDENVAFNDININNNEDVFSKAMEQRTYANYDLKEQNVVLSTAFKASSDKVVLYDSAKTSHSSCRKISQPGIYIDVCICINIYMYIYMYIYIYMYLLVNI